MICKWSKERTYFQQALCLELHHSLPPPSTEYQLHLLHKTFDIVIWYGDQSGGKGHVLIEAPLAEWLPFPPMNLENWS